MKTKYLKIVRELLERPCTFQQLKEAIEEGENREELLRACMWIFTESLPEESASYRNLKKNFTTTYRKDIFSLLGYLDKGRRIFVEKDKMEFFFQFQIKLWKTFFPQLSFRFFARMVYLSFDTGYQEESLRKKLEEWKDLVEKETLPNCK